MTSIPLTSSAESLNVDEILKQPAKPLKDAVKSFGTAPDMDIHVFYAVEGAKVIKKRNPASKLTIEEIAALRLYTTAWTDPAASIGALLLAAIRENNATQLSAFKPFLRLILGALRSIPSTRTVLTRYASGDFSTLLTPGSTITWGEISSATVSTDPIEADQSSHPHVQLLIDTSHARSIQAYSRQPTEPEYLLFPGSQFKVHSVKQVADGFLFAILSDISVFPCLGDA